MRLLVAEQDQALGMFLERSFDAENYAVDIAVNGESAKAMADAQVPAINKTQATVIASRPTPRISFCFSVSRISLLSRVLASKIPMA